MPLQQFVGFMRGRGAPLHNPFKRRGIWEEMQ